MFYDVFCCMARDVMCMAEGYKSFITQQLTEAKKEKQAKKLQKTAFTPEPAFVVHTKVMKGGGE